MTTRYPAHSSLARPPVAQTPTESRAATTPACARSKVAPPVVRSRRPHGRAREATRKAAAPPKIRVTARRWEACADKATSAPAIVRAAPKTVDARREARSRVSETSRAGETDGRQMDR